MDWTFVRRAAVLAAVLASAPAGVLAQDVPAAPPAAPSRLTVQPVEDGWLAAPDFKYGEIAGHDAAIVGGYGGWVTDRTLLVGGGAYWLANGQDGTEMVYGGLVLEWLARTDRRIGFGARTLIGGGEATVPVSPVEVYGPHPLASDAAIRFGTRHGGGRHGRPMAPGALYPPHVLWDDVFFIAEPQVNALLNLTGWCRINVGVGYRLIGGASAIDDQLRGMSGTIAVQFGGRH